MGYKLRGVLQARGALPPARIVARGAAGGAQLAAGRHQAGHLDR